MELFSIRIQRTFQLVSTSDDNQVRHFCTDREDGRGYICTGLAGKQLMVVS